MHHSLLQMGLHSESKVTKQVISTVDQQKNKQISLLALNALFSRGTQGTRMQYNKPEETMGCFGKLL